MFRPTMTAVTLGWGLVKWRVGPHGIGSCFLTPDSAQQLCSPSAFAAFGDRSEAHKNIGVGG